MRIGLQNTDWAYIGAYLARGDDKEQAEFFKSFAKESLSYGTNHQAEMQLASINCLLSKEEKELLSMITYIDNN